jgi:protein-S-isoprenylcysteine O-methyltransferase Ste14
MRVPPLLLLAGSVAASTLLARGDPAARPSSATRGAGAALGAAGVTIAIAGVAAFRRHRTTVDPTRPERASTLVAGGVYGWTRNPMYLGFVAAGAGVAVALGSPRALAGPLALALYLDRAQIPAEERALAARFGAAYAAYARAVRRWAGRRAA